MNNEEKSQRSDTEMKNLMKQAIEEDDYEKDWQFLMGLGVLVIFLWILVWCGVEF